MKDDIRDGGCKLRRLAWIYAASSVLWAIWLERNRRIFEEEYEQVDDIW